MEMIVWKKTTPWQLVDRALTVMAKTLLTVFVAMAMAYCMLILVLTLSVRGWEFPADPAISAALLIGTFGWVSVTALLVSKFISMGKGAKRKCK